MGLPAINITFSKTAATVSKRSGQCTVAMIVLDDGAPTGLYTVVADSDIPLGLSAENKNYIKNALKGYINRPEAVKVYVAPADAESYAGALAALGSEQFDWLVAPPTVEMAGVTEIKTWLRAQRNDFGATYKAVLPNCIADDPAIVNFTGTNIRVNGTTYTTAGYCSRIAGLIAGTPLTHSATYVPLAEVEDILRPTKTEADNAVDTGKLVLIHDGAKVKTGRAVTSLTTVSGAYTGEMKKIKIMSAMDIINHDLRTLIEDNYIGKMSNSYDNKCVLVTAIKSYVMELEADGIAKEGSTVGIDVDATREYLRAQGVNVAKLTDEEIKTADTGTSVFVAVSLKLLDAVEDVTVNVRY